MPRHVFTALVGLVLFNAVSAYAQGPAADNPAEVVAEPVPPLSPDGVGPRDSGWIEGGNYGGGYGGFVPRPPAFPPGGVFSYPTTDDYSNVVDTNGWPVAIPFGYYPQGAISEEGVGVYQCLLPADRPEDSFCTPPPCYFGTFYVGGVIFNRRSNLESTTLYVDSTGTEVLNTSDLGLSTEAGFRLGFWISNPSGIDWNVDYLNVGNFSATATRSDPAGITDNFFGLNSTLTTQIAQYESTVQSLDFTLRARQWRRLAPLVGARFLQVDEHFNSMQDLAANQGWFSRTDNQLYGMQFGFQGLICEKHWWRLETILKIGPFYNDVGVNVTANPVAGVQQSRSVSFSTTSLVTDARIGIVCQMGPRANFRIGYQAIWIEGIALGTNQSNNISLTTNVETVDLSGVLYQGGDIGFEVSW